VSSLLSRVAEDADKRVSEFSKGMRGRLNVARALKLRYGTRFVCVEHDVDSQRERLEFPLYGLTDNPEFLTALRPSSL